MANSTDITYDVVYSLTALKAIVTLGRPLLHVDIASLSDSTYNLLERHAILATKFIFTYPKDYRNRALSFMLILFGFAGSAVGS